MNFQNQIIVRDNFILKYSSKVIYIFIKMQLFKEKFKLK